MVDGQWMTGDLTLKASNINSPVAKTPEVAAARGEQSAHNPQPPYQNQEKATSSVGGCLREIRKGNLSMGRENLLMILSEIPRFNMQALINFWPRDFLVIAHIPLVETRGYKMGHADGII